MPDSFACLLLIALRQSHPIPVAHVREIEQTPAEEAKLVGLALGGPVDHGAVDERRDLVHLVAVAEGQLAQQRAGERQTAGLAVRQMGGKVLQGGWREGSALTSLPALFSLTGSSSSTRIGMQWTEIVCAESHRVQFRISSLGPRLMGEWVSSWSSSWPNCNKQQNGKAIVNKKSKIKIK
jgi:hypothetical protein